MAKDSGWIYGGWEKGGAHTKEWMNKTQEFIDCAFSLSNNCGMKCPCSRCRNVVCEGKRMLTLHIYKIGFMSGYEVCMHHSESVCQITSVAEEDDRTSDDRMNVMFDAIQSDLETNHLDPSTSKVQKFFNIHRALEKLLHEHTIINVLVIG
jgi:hypothetical protein